MSIAVPSVASIKLNILDLFVVSTALTIVGIRLFLELTGYPQIGNNGLHIAHMLWGGLAMGFVILYLLLSDKPHRYVSALVAGVGFGFFIDEIGKFVTSDNDYFFAPTAFLIYIIVLAIWLVSRLLIVRHYGGSLMSAAVWPPRPIERLGIIAYAAVHIATGTAALVVSLFGGSLLGLSGFVEFVFACIVAVAVVLYGLGIDQYFRGSAARASATLRTAALITLVAIYPLVFYREQFSAAIGCLATIAVILGLSQTSFRSILAPLFRNPEN